MKNLIIAATGAGDRMEDLRELELILERHGRIRRICTAHFLLFTTKSASEIKELLMETYCPNRGAYDVLVVEIADLFNMYMNDVVGFREERLNTENGEMEKLREKDL